VTTVRENAEPLEGTVGISSRVERRAAGRARSATLQHIPTTTLTEVNMKKLCLAVAVLLLLPSACLFSQEWSAAQKEVWKNVEAYWALDAVGNLEGFMAYFHNDYMGWDINEPLPMDKASVRKFIEHDYKTEKTLVYNIKPVAINVIGNVAIADYYYTTIAKDAEGKEKTRSGRWCDILMKQGDKWVIVGDHGGRTSKD
jgi:ketosteroid isomerase-like protein